MKHGREAKSLWIVEDIVLLVNQSLYTIFIRHASTKAGTDKPGAHALDISITMLCLFLPFCALPIHKESSKRLSHRSI